MRLSVIICTYNRAKYIFDVLKSIVDNSFSKELFEIVLVNNNSTDNTEAECKRFQSDYPTINFHYFIENNQGLSFARNRGIVESKGEWLIFLDDDAFVGKDYLQNLTDNLQNYPDAMAFGGKIIPLFEAGSIPTWMSPWSYSWVSALDMGNKVQLFKAKAYPIGANMGVLRTCITQCGDFNTALGRSKDNLMGGEEKDFFNRVKAKGGNIYYFPTIPVQHIIPEHRTTKEFIGRLALGVGKSERARTKKISNYSYRKRLLAELIKWGATMILFAFYLLTFKPSKGAMLVLFRRNVSLGLLGKK